MPEIVGSWRAVEWCVGFSDGSPSVYPYGDEIDGLFCAAPDGWMNLTLFCRSRPTIAPERQTPELEKIGALGGFINYGGRWEVQGEDLVFTVLHAMPPAFVGSQQRRRMTFHADGRLTLSATQMPAGENVARHHDLTWRRA
jgi:hypothetical protein